MCSAAHHRPQRLCDNSHELCAECSASLGPSYVTRRAVRLPAVQAQVAAQHILRKCGTACLTSALRGAAQQPTLREKETMGCCSLTETSMIQSGCETTWQQHPAGPLGALGSACKPQQWRRRHPLLRGVLGRFPHARADSRKHPRSQLRLELSILYGYQCVLANSHGTPTLP